MNKLLLLLALTFAATAEAQITLTPSVSHSYEVIKGEVNYVVADEPGLGEEKGTSYQNSVRFDLELSAGSRAGLEYFVDLGYTHLPEANQNIDVRSLDFGLRRHFSGLFVQANIGLQQIYTAPQSGDPATNFVLPTAGLGVGYDIALNPRIDLSLFYRGSMSLTSSAEKRAVNYTNGYADTRIQSIESHQAGLGVAFKL